MNKIVATIFVAAIKYIDLIKDKMILLYNYEEK